MSLDSLALSSPSDSLRFLLLPPHLLSMWLSGHQPTVTIRSSHAGCEGRSLRTAAVPTPRAGYVWQHPVWMLVHLQNKTASHVLPPFDPENVVN